MALKGQAKYMRKIHAPGTAGARSQMGGGYREARDRATTGYSAVFGPKRAEAYHQAYLTYAVENYQPENVWGDKWRRNWLEAMQR